MQNWVRILFILDDWAIYGNGERLFDVIPGVFREDHYWVISVKSCLRYQLP